MNHNYLPGQQLCIIIQKFASSFLGIILMVSFSNNLVLILFICGFFSFHTIVNNMRLNNGFCFNGSSVIRSNVPIFIFCSVSTIKCFGTLLFSFGIHKSHFLSIFRYWGLGFILCALIFIRKSIF